MNEAIEREKYIQPTSEELTRRLLALETEYLSAHNSALRVEGDKTFFRPDVQTTVKLTQMLKEGANILTQLEPLLNAENSAVLNEWKRDKWPIKKFQEEVDRRDALARKRPSASETSQQEPQAKVSKNQKK